MSRGVPGALRYCHLEDWDCPTALYLVEKRSPPGAWLIARPALDVESLWEEMNTAVLPYGRKGLAVMALSGVDLALWDLR